MTESIKDKAAENTARLLSAIASDRAEAIERLEAAGYTEKDFNAAKERATGLPAEPGQRETTMATTTTQAKLRRCKAYPGTIMTDKVGSVEIGGRHVADFCEVNPDSFYTENDVGKVFCGTESEVITHYSTSD